MFEGKGTTDAPTKSTLIAYDIVNTIRTGKAKRLAPKGRSPVAGIPVQHPSKDEPRRQFPVLVTGADAHDEVAHDALFLI